MTASICHGSKEMIVIFSTCEHKEAFLSELVGKLYLKGAEEERDKRNLQWLKKSEPGRAG